jgi:hypothetical protein
MTAAALIGGPATMVAPYRIAQIQIARIGRGADHCATNRAGGRAQSGISGRRTNSRAACRAQQSATCCPVTRVSTATRDEQSRGKTRNNHGCAHIWLP